jgi:hypothetical protein
MKYFKETKKVRNLLNAFKILGLVIVIMAAASLVQAQATRTWVSGVGDDANPCSRTAPCKTFAGAISKTAVLGEINCLDPAGFGAVTITKSIMIDCTGLIAGVLVTAGNGININITTPSDPGLVRLRGLDINGLNTAGNGIRIIAANSVDIENTNIYGFAGHGISLEWPAELNVRNSNIRNNVGNGINTFIWFNSASLTVSDSQLMNNAAGINLSSLTKATVNFSKITNNTTGVSVYNADMTLMGCDISKNTTGVSGNTANIRLNGNTITSNTTGLSGSSIVSYGNNVIQGNGTNGSATSTVTLQ